MRIDHIAQHDAFSDSGCHMQVVEDKNSYKIEKRGEHHGLRRFEDACGNDGGNGVGCIMKAVHEVKHDGQPDEHDDHPKHVLCHRRSAGVLDG